MAKKKDNKDKPQQASEPEAAYGKKFGKIVFFNSVEEENEYTHRYYASLKPEESLAQVTHMRLLRNPHLSTNLNPWGNKVYPDWMETLTQAHKKFLIDLLDAGVEFMLVGGYAVNFHGYPRYTADMDIWLKPDNDNKQKFTAFLEQMGFEPESINHVRSRNFSQANSFHIGQG